MTDAQKSAMLAIICELSIPDWTDCQLEFEMFANGITNEIICAINVGTAQRMVFRVFGKGTDLLINRLKYEKSYRIE